MGWNKGPGKWVNQGLTGAVKDFDLYSEMTSQWRVLNGRIMII